MEFMAFNWGGKKEFPNDNVKENLNSLEVRCPEKHLMN